MKLAKKWNVLLGVIGAGAVLVPTVATLAITYSDNNVKHSTKSNSNVGVKQFSKKQQIENFKKNNFSRTDFLNFSMPKLDVVTKDQNNNFLTLIQKTSDVKRFIDNNQDKIEKIYKLVYNNHETNGAISPIQIADNYKKLPAELKSFANTFRYKINGLRQMVAESQSQDPQLWADEWYWFDLNVYYNPSNVISYIQFLQDIENNYLNPVSDVGGDISDSGNVIKSWGNQISTVAGSLLQIFGGLLQIASKLGDGIINSILNTLYTAESNNEGATTHWLFGFIYVGTSLGNDEWWGS